MTESRNAFQVGLAVLVAAAIFVAVIIFLSTPMLFAATTFRVRFPHTYPMPLLEPGSIVLVGGQKAGAVESLDLELQPIRKRTEPGTTEAIDLFVVVSARIRGDLKMRRDCKVYAEAPPLGGPGTLRVELGNAEQLLRADDIVEGEFPAGLTAAIQTVNSVLGRELNGQDPNSLLGLVKQQLDARQAASLVAKLHRSMEDFNAVTSAARMQFDPQQRGALLAKLNLSMDHVNAVTAALRDQTEAQRSDAIVFKVHRALDALNNSLAEVFGILSDNRAPIHETLTHAARTAETLDTRVMDGLAREFDVANAAGLLAKVHVAADRINATLANLHAVSETARTVAALNRDKINDTLSNLKQTSDHINTSVKFVLRRPWLIFKAPPESESRQKDIFDAAARFAEAAARLDDASAELRALTELRGGVVPDDDADLARLRARLDETLSKFTEAENALWKELGVLK